MHIHGGWCGQRVSCISMAVIAVATGGCRPEDDATTIQPSNVSVVVPAGKASAKQPPIPPGDLNRSDEVPDRYRFLLEGGLDPKQEDATRAALPYTEIQFERTRCFGSCPAYTVTLRANGTAEYLGEAHVRNKGLHFGEIDIFTYARLCWAIEKYNPSGKPQDFHANWTDAATAILRIQKRGADRMFVIRDYGSQGPIDLWTLQTAIDGIVSGIEWKNGMP